MTKAILRQALDALQAALSDDQPYIERSVAAIAALQAAIDEPEPDIGDTLDKFLCNGTRIKLNFNKAGNMTSLQNMAHDLQGRWVALVPAENDCHLKYTNPPAVREPITQERAEALAHRRCKRYVFIDDVPYQFDAKTLMDFVRDIEGPSR